MILGCFYQRQDQILRNEAAVRAGVANVAQWVKGCGFTNVVLEIANEFGHGGFDHNLLKTAAGQVELIGLAKKVHPGLLVSTSDVGDGTIPKEVAEAADFLLIHFNGTKVEDIPGAIGRSASSASQWCATRTQDRRRAGRGRPRLCVAAGASWGLMLEKTNQHFPFAFQGAADEPTIYAAVKKLTSP